jgi:hypothetical protein
MKAGLERRIHAVERRYNQSTIEFEVVYATMANATTGILSGMKSDDPNVIELSWSNEKPADDGQKIRWLKQYTQEQISEMRAAWERSPCIRDAVALRELDRLLTEWGHNCSGIEGRVGKESGCS